MAKTPKLTEHKFSILRISRFAKRTGRGTNKLNKISHNALPWYDYFITFSPERINIAVCLALVFLASPFSGENEIQRVDQLLQELKSENPEVSYRAAEAFSQLGSDEKKLVVPTLLGILKDPKLIEHNSGLRFLTVRAIGNIGGPAANSAVPILKAIQASRKERSDMQAEAWVSLMKIYRTDPNPKVRLKAAENMGRTGPWAIPFLKEMLKDHNEIVRKAAEEALIRQHVQESR